MNNKVVLRLSNPIVGKYPIPNNMKTPSPKFYSIIKNLPIPVDGRNQVGLRGALQALKVGDAMHVPRAIKLRQRLHVNAKALGIRITYRTNCKSILVWRVK